MATSILTILSEWEGEIALRSSYSSLGGSEMTTSILLVLCQGMRGQPPPPTLRQKNNINLRRHKKERGLATPFVLFCPEGDGEMATSILTLLL